MDIWTSDGHGGELQNSPSFHARSRPELIQRLVDRRVSAVEPLLAAARQRGQAESLDINAWAVEETLGPNVTDKETILSLAKMTLDAYTQEPFTGEWQDVKGGFNYSQSFGWESDGLRGHIYADKHNSTIIIGLKGTSAGKLLALVLLKNKGMLIYPQQYLTALELQQMIRLMIICSSAVAVRNKGTFFGSKCAAAEQKLLPAIRHA